MGVHLVTGYAGKEHITSADHGAYNAGTYGPGKYVLRTGNMFAAEVISNNLIKIKDGDLINQGRHINIPVNDYEECEIDNGLQSVKRNDLIVVRYTKNNETMIEAAQVLVLKGVSSATPADPKYVTGDILNGAETDDFPLYRVRLNGLSIENVEPLFSTIVSVKDILSLIGSKDISKLGDGTITGGLSALNTGLEGKQPSITGAASSIASSNLTASRALVSNSAGKVAVSAVTSTELGYLDGVTSNVQTQLNGKQAKLINPLTQSDVINNLTSTETKKPLSAAQGKILSDTISQKSRVFVQGVTIIGNGSNWAVVSNDGKYLAAAQTVRDDADYYITGITKQSSTGLYTLIFNRDVSNGGKLVAWLTWID